MKSNLRNKIKIWSLYLQESCRWVDGVAPPEEDDDRYYTLEGESIRQVLIGELGFYPDCFTLTLDDDGKPNILITKCRKGSTYEIVDIFEFCVNNESETN